MKVTIEFCPSGCPDSHGHEDIEREVVNHALLKLPHGAEEWTTCVESKQTGDCEVQISVTRVYRW